MAGRPAKPMFPAPERSPVEEAFEDLEQGAMSYEDAAKFTSLSRPELERVVARGEIEVFTYGRRVLLVGRSVRMWLAKRLAEQRALSHATRRA